MAELHDFDDSIRREERDALHDELLARIAQKGLIVPDTAPTDQLADLLSEIDRFEAAVEKAGGDLFVDSPDSSEPERPEFVLPHMRDDENLAVYTGRVRTATARLAPLAKW